MNDTFSEWIRENPSIPQCMRAYSDRLQDLGISWETFDRKESDIVEDLIAEGIPRIAARDIAAAGSRVRQDALHMVSAPLAVFWDAENVGVPRETSGRAVTEAIKRSFSGMGSLSTIRCYVSVTTQVINEQKRSELSLGGAHIVDTPHLHRKEVADKMIIVDAMEFAYLHPDGATMVFITSDEDFAYMLAKLDRPRWRTVVVTKGTMSRTMLHSNANMTLTWETDILQIRPTVSAVGFPQPVVATPVTVDVEAMPTEHSEDDEEGLSRVATDVELVDEDLQLKDNFTTLRIVVEKLCRDTGCSSASKSTVGIMLRTRNPLRFSDRDSVRALFQQAIQSRLLVEHGEGATKRVSLASDSPTSSELLIVSDDPPPWVLDALRTLPEKAAAIASQLKPFLLVVLKSCVAPLAQLSQEGVYVTSTTTAMVLMCRTYSSANQAAAALSAMIRNGILVDYRKLGLPLVDAPPASSDVLERAGMVVLGALNSSNGRLLWAEAANRVHAAGFGSLCGQVKRFLLDKGHIIEFTGPKGHPVIALRGQAVVPPPAPVEETVSLPEEECNRLVEVVEHELQQLASIDFPFSYVSALKNNVLIPNGFNVTKATLVEVLTAHPETFAVSHDTTRVALAAHAAAVSEYRHARDDDAQVIGDGLLVLHSLFDARAAEFGSTGIPKEDAIEALKSSGMHAFATDMLERCSVFSAAKQRGVMTFVSNDAHRCLLRRPE